MSALRVLADPSAAAPLVHPLRRRILEALASPDSASGVARRLDLPRQQVNYHLRELESAGFVRLHEERRKGNCTERIVAAVARSYLIAPGALGAALSGDGAAGAAAGAAHASDKFSSDYLVAAASRLIGEVAALRERAEEAGKTLATLTLHADIRFRNAAERHEFAQELSDCVARLAAKYHDPNAPRGRRFRAMVGVHPALDERRAAAQTDPPSKPQ